MDNASKVNSTESAPNWLPRLVRRLSSRSQDAVDLWLDDWRAVVMAASLDSCEAMAAQHSEFGYRGVKVDLATCPLCHAKRWLASRGFICAQNTRD